MQLLGLLVREVDTVRQLRSAVIGALHTDNTQPVAHGDAFGLKAVLAVVASSAPTWIAAIHVGDVGVILQVQVAIGRVNDSSTATRCLTVSVMRAHRDKPKRTSCLGFVYCGGHGIAVNGCCSHFYGVLLGSVNSIVGGRMMGFWS